MKYAAIVTYSNGASTGATVCAEGSKEAWDKIVKLFGGGDSICNIQISAIITEEREAGFDGKKRGALSDTMLSLIDRKAIRFEGFSWCFGMVDLNVMSTVFSDKKFVMSVKESDWNDGPEEAVALMLAELVEEGELKFDTAEDCGNTMTGKTVIFRSDGGREIDMVLNVKNYDEKFRDTAVEGMYHWDGIDDEYCDFMLAWLKKAGYSADKIEYSEVYDN